MESSTSSSSESSSSSGIADSPLSLLDAVETAIHAVLNNQSYRLGDRTVTRANLAELTDLREKLKAEVASFQGKRPLVSFPDMGGF